MTKKSRTNVELNDKKAKESLPPVSRRPQSLNLKQSRKNLNTSSPSNADIEAETRDGFCLACNKTAKFELFKDDWFCSECGRNEQAARHFNSAFDKTTEIVGANPTVDSYVELAIKATLLISLFPISLIFLVAVYGMDGAVDIVKQLFIDLFRTALAILLLVVVLVVLIIILLNIFGK